MKQQNFLENAKKDDGTQEHHAYWKLFIDGASRNNPGPAGAGLYIVKNDHPVEKRGFFLGAKTNNQAEYLALLLGLFYMQKRYEKGDLLLIISDSQLLIKQMEGKYRVKHPGIKPLYTVAQALLVGMRYDLMHVLREENKQADAMANEGIDKRHKIPEDFLALLAKYEIKL
jgi:ribonuclease HI